MSYAAEKTTIEQAVNTNFTTVQGIDTIYDNVPYDGSKDEWVRVTILPADAKQIDLGPGGTHRYTGVLTFQIFVRPNVGSGRALAIADLLSPIFRAQRISTIMFRTPAVRVVGRDPEGEWFQVNLSVNFFREES